MRHLTVVSLLGLASSACISTITPPEPTAQAKVSYGPKIFLRDATFGEPTVGRPCVLLGKVAHVATGTSATATSTTIGGELLVRGDIPFNCYVDVTPGELYVDQIETTNRLFQLCIDSSVCKKPSPADVDKVPVCRSEADFDSCPIVALQQFEANRFCNFIGRRLPTGIESIVMRSGTNPQTPDGVTTYAYGDSPDPGNNCEQAVLSGCANKPYPIQGSETEPKGAARLDKTSGTAPIFDLSGNVTEWSGDLLPANGRDPALPWFCEAPLVTSATVATVCPRGEVCIRGSKLIGDTIQDVAVCLASHNLSINNGTIGSTFGGAFNTAPSKQNVGVFARTARSEPNKDQGEANIGFRCVGQAGTETTIVPVRAQ
jgi:formylglycine-generating enzyme required for sulfatase activity